MDLFLIIEQILEFENKNLGDLKNHFEEHDFSSINIFFHKKEFIKLDILEYEQKIIYFFKEKGIDFTLFINNLKKIIFQEMEQNFNFVYFKNFFTNMLNKDISIEDTKKFISLFLSLKIIKHDHLSYLIIHSPYYHDDINLYFDNKEDNDENEKIVIYYRNILEAINFFYHNENIKNAIITKLQGFSDTHIVKKFNINGPKFKYIWSSFLVNKFTDLIEEKLENFFQINKISFSTLTKFLDLPWESYSYIMYKLNIKPTPLYSAHLANELKLYLASHNIPMRTKKIENVEIWISNSTNSNVIFANDLNFLRNKIEDKSLEEIGNIFSVTKERVRQKIKNLNIYYPYLEEMNYIDIFNEYDLNYNTFYEISKLSIKSFYFLKIICKTNMSDKLPEIDFISKTDLMSEESKEKLFLQSKKISVNGELINLNWITIAINFLKANSKSMSIEEVYSHIKNNYSSLLNVERSSRTLANALTFSDFILTSTHFFYRYFDIKSIFEELYDDINGMIDGLEGIYSTQFFIDNFKELMFKLNINNKYELHNFFKKTINNKSISFSRMPIIYFGYKDKESFYSDLLNELSPIAYKDFCHYLANNFGWDFLGTQVNLVKTLSEFYSDGYLSLNINKLNIEELDKNFLDSLQSKTMHTILEVKDIFNHHNINTSYINGFNMKSLGFSLHKNYAIKKSTNIEIEINKILENNGFYNDEFFQVTKRHAIEYFQKELYNFDFLNIAKNKIVTMDVFFQKTNINKSSLWEEINLVSEFLKQNQLLGIKSIIKNMENLKIFNGCLTEFGIKKLLFFSKKIKIYDYVDFCLCSSIDNVLNVNSFIEDIIKKCKSIYKSDLINILKDITGENITSDWLNKRKTNFLDVFYCKEIEKFYENEKLYLEEIYN